MRLQLDKQTVRGYLACNGNRSTYAKINARKDGYSFSDGWWSQVVQQIKNEPQEDDLQGVVAAPDKRRNQIDTSTDVYVFTCAQNNTKLHTGFWQSLMTYIGARNAKLLVSRFVYNKAALAACDAKSNTSEDSDGDDIWYDPRIEPYVSDESLQVTDDLVWCGELNIIPTRVHPLSTLKTYTRGHSGIVPHVKMRMDSVPTMKYDRPVFMYTTGTVTQRNYIQRVAGQVAEFHHVFGALVVEVDRTTGEWWARQLNAETDSGCFYDLDHYYTPRDYNDACRVRAITHGDIHHEKRDQSVLDAVFRDGGIVDQLMPYEQYLHDTIDFRARNHHNIKDPHHLWRMRANNSDSVVDEIQQAADFVYKATRRYCRTYIVTSNHDVAITGWLKNTTAFFDPANAEYWLELNLNLLRSIREGREACPFATAINTALYKKAAYEGGQYPNWRVIGEDESHYIAGTDIQAGMHGHLGPNGARGNPLNLRSVGKANTGHTHSAGIVDGIYTAGVYGSLDMGYNKGLSSWSHSFITTYLNGKRAIFTIRNGRAWRDQIRSKL